MAVGRLLCSWHKGAPWYSCGGGNQSASHTIEGMSESGDQVLGLYSVRGSSNGHM